MTQSQEKIGSTKSTSSPSLFKQIVFYAKTLFLFEIVAFGYILIATPFIGALPAVLRLTHWLVYRFFDIKVIKIGPCQEKVEDFNGIIMPSHKGYGDFFLTPVFGDGAMFGRMATAFFVPAASVFSKFTNMFFIIKRGSRNFEELESRLKDFLDRRNPRVIVFPEGHRNREGRGVLQLRTGIFRMAFNQRIKVMLCPCEGSQYILNEFNCNWKLRKELVVNYAAILDPNEFKTWEEFHAEANKIFIEGYEDACREYDRSIEQKKDAIPF